MDRYHIALFLHIVTILVAGGAGAVAKLAVGRRARARTVGDALDWHNLLVSASRVFPICLAVFVITGSYMVSLTGIRAWSTGFVVAGLVGSALLLASGMFLGIKGKALAQVLEQIAKEGSDRPVPKLVPPPLVVVLPMVNTAIAISVMFDMVTKPASIPVALGVIAIGIGLGTAVALQLRPSHAPQEREVARAA